MIRVFFILGLVFGIEGSTGAATWFVRPGVFSTLDHSGHPLPTAGIYGTQNGTSYSNAWNGLTSIIWGGSGVKVGDTIYACGAHIYHIPVWTTNWFQQGVSVIGVSGITIRGDYPGDPFTLFGGSIDYYHAYAPYYGPDANGVYWQKINNGGAEAPLFEITESTIARLARQTNITWTGSGSGEYFRNSTNYVRRSDGQAPSTNNMAMQYYGWAFNLNNQSNIIFQSCNFISENAGPNHGGLIIPLSFSPFTNATRHIVFTNCTFFDSAQFNIYPGEDSFAFLDCEIGRHASGIYSLLNGQKLGANNITISNCFIHDTGTAEYNDGDAHAVGIQGGNYHLITHNTTSNTGPAIVLWAGNQDMKSNIISYNFVFNTHTNTSSGSSAGIAIGGDNSTALFGRRTGCKICGNIILNCAVGSGLLYQGQGINLNLPDYIEVENNTIYGGNVGIDIEVVQAGYGVSAKVVNNIILQPMSKYYYIVGAVAPTNLVVDYNLLYPAVALSNWRTVYPNITHDQHSVFADPQFFLRSPAIASDFRLKAASPAIGAGVSVGLPRDFAGNAIPSARPPDIGAFEWVEGPLPPIELYVLPSR